jgi:hypothetical protein
MSAAPWEAFAMGSAALPLTREMLSVALEVFPLKGEASPMGREAFATTREVFPMGREAFLTVGEMLPVTGEVSPISRVGRLNFLTAFFWLIWAGLSSQPG